MNDSAEFNYALDLLLSLVKEKYSMINVHSTTIHFLELWPQIRIFPNVYVTAFSTESDQLSQWRSYCPPVGGFNIGFDKEKLRQYLESQEAELDRCIYKANEQRNLLNEVAQKIFALHKAYERDTKFEDLTLEQKTESSVMFREIVRQIFKLAPRVKHPSFSEENEWRLVIQDTRPEKKNAQYRISRSLLIPYVEVGPIDQDCFAQIVVGPCPHIDLSQQSVERFILATLGRKIKVIKSAIPYRNW